jgi:hypothetical protein
MEYHPNLIQVKDYPGETFDYVQICILEENMIDELYKSKPMIGQDDHDQEGEGVVETTGNVDQSVVGNQEDGFPEEPGTPQMLYEYREMSVEETKKSFEMSSKADQNEVAQGEEENIELLCGSKVRRDGAQNRQKDEKQERY